MKGIKYILILTSLIQIAFARVDLRNIYNPIVKENILISSNDLGEISKKATGTVTSTYDKIYITKNNKNINYKTIRRNNYYIKYSWLTMEEPKVYLNIYKDPLINNFLINKGNLYYKTNLKKDEKISFTTSDGFFLIRDGRYINFYKRYYRAPSFWHHSKEKILLFRTQGYPVYVFDYSKKWDRRTFKYLITIKVIKNKDVNSEFEGSREVLKITDNNQEITPFAVYTGGLYIYTYDKNLRNYIGDIFYDVPLFEIEKIPITFVKNTKSDKYDEYNKIVNGYKYLKIIDREDHSYLRVLSRKGGHYYHNINKNYYAKSRKIYLKMGYVEND